MKIKNVEYGITITYTDGDFTKSGKKQIKRVDWTLQDLEKTNGLRNVLKGISVISIVPFMCVF